LQKDKKKQSKNMLDKSLIGPNDKSLVGPNETCARKLTFILLLWIRILLGVGTSCQQ